MNEQPTTAAPDRPTDRPPGAPGVKKIGLALSGGGFRATVYHLGLVRFLRDAGILPNVTHITAVSGGSICAAHLALNWDRYNGSAADFDAAAAEVLAFARLDMRNRIIRRFPLLLPLRGVRRLVGLSNRKMTRTGLLEYHYEQYLYGDTSLFQLPEHPRLHILSTNLSEGCLCSFNRDGLWMIRRAAGHRFRIDQISVGLATVPMAVAASSAFPGFFPPLVLTGAEVGARSGEFARQAYTDGAVFDNLGVRMFHHLAHSASADQRPWDAVLVSDVGKPFEVQNSVRASGLIRTALRASDILMDRVWQLENETLQGASGFVFARITDVVEPDVDPTALHPELQRQLARVRTDLDRFSELEINCLVRHGYCVGRKACRALPEVFGTKLPDNPPWEPKDEKRAAPVAVAAPGAATPGATEPAPAAPAPAAHGPMHEPAPITKEARTLNASAARRIWSTLLDHRDWTSYVYVPIIIPILVLLPYAAIKYYRHTHRIHQIVQSLAQESRDVEQMSRLLDGPVAPWTGEAAEQLPSNDTPNLKGFTILQDMRIIDLRRWKPGTSHDPDSHIYGYRRLKVQKDRDNANNNAFRVSVLALSSEAQVRFPAQQLRPKLYSRPLPPSASGENLVHWEVGVDFQKVPAGDFADVVYEHMSPGVVLRDGIDSTTLAFVIEAETIELTRWLLMPKGREYRSFQMIRYQTGKPETAETVKLVTEFLADDYTILAFKLLALKPGYTYELTWFYR
jgi:predicted acylesterase/phospholipase RssA